MWDGVSGLKETFVANSIGEELVGVILPYSPLKSRKLYTF
jgi:hypothetical protein